MKTFTFEFGDSTGGVIGMSVCVKAENKAEAVAKLRSALPWSTTMNFTHPKKAADVFDLTIYLNAENITAKNIESVEKAEAA